MTKIHKKIQHARQAERSKFSATGHGAGTASASRSHSSEADRKAGVATAIGSHDFRFRDEKTLEGLGLDPKSQKQLARVKKFVSKK
jgi:hypothetical protein